MYSLVYHRHIPILCPLEVYLISISFLFLYLSLNSGGTGRDKRQKTLKQKIKALSLSCNLLVTKIFRDCPIKGLKSYACV
jgi:hypothetical protein